MHDPPLHSTSAVLLQPTGRQPTPCCPPKPCRLCSCCRAAHTCACRCPGLPATSAPAAAQSRSNAAGSSSSSTKTATSSRPAAGARSSVSAATHQQLHRLLAAHSHVRRDLLVTADGPLAHGVARLAEHGLLAGQLLQHVQAGRQAGRRRQMSGGARTAASESMQPTHARHAQRQWRQQQAAAVSAAALGSSARPGKRMQTWPLPQHRPPAAATGAYLSGLLQAISALAGAAVQHQLRDADVPHGVAGLLVSHL